MKPPKQDKKTMRKPQRSAAIAAKMESAFGRVSPYLKRTPSWVWLAIAIGVCAVELTLLHPVPFAVTLRTTDSQEARNATLPIANKSKYDAQEFSVQMNVWVSLFTSRSFNLIADDCVTAVHVNGELVDISAISESARCDFRKGFRLDLAKSLSLGSNQIRVQVKNKDGEWGFRMETATAKGRWWFLLFTLVTLVSVALSRWASAAAKQIRRSIALPAFIVLIIGYCTIFDSYWKPSALFWDENYHITAAQKYLNGVFFMEPHPPLGKLLIALGEEILTPNAKTNQFIDTENANVPNQDISFVGYRFIPTLLAWWSALLFFFVLHALTRQPWLALCLSSLYLFDNAMIVHLRGAMLDSTMIFFSLACILGLIKTYQKRHLKRPYFFWMAVSGLAFGACGATKVLALIWILILPFVLWRTFNVGRNWRKTLTGASVFFAGAAVVFLGVWQVHFSLAQEVRPALPDKGFYQADANYKQVLKAGEGGSLRSFPLALINHLKFLPHYSKGVPVLNLCKVDNGSPYFLWPFGGRTINYRWAAINSDSTQYLYLVANPWNWALGLFGLFLAMVRLSGALFGPKRAKAGRNAPYVVLLLTYAAYMVTIARIPRVMYLYHYFLPLLVTYFIFALELRALPRIGPWKIQRALRRKLALGVALFSFGVFLAYSPLTYYKPLSSVEVGLRSVAGIWDLRCNGCGLDNGYFAPVPVPESPAARPPAAPFALPPNLAKH